MPKIIKRGEKIEKPRWIKWMGVNGTKESAQLSCPFCETTFVLVKGDYVFVRSDCLDNKNVVARYFIKCPNCEHRSNHKRAVVESNAA